MSKGADQYAGLRSSGVENELCGAIFSSIQWVTLFAVMSCHPDRRWHNRISRRLLPAL
jgi:hypothetical protein